VLLTVGTDWIAGGIIRVVLRLVFAYPFHFGKSGFSAYFFTPNPDFIRIFLCRSVSAPIYCLAVVSDTGDVGLLMKIKMQ